MAAERDAWMSECSFVPTYSLNDLRKKQTEDRKQKEEQRAQEKVRYSMYIDRFSDYEIILL